MRFPRVRDFSAFVPSGNGEPRKCYSMSPSSNTELQAPSVEELVTAFKRRGHFDALRKATLSSFQGGVIMSSFFPNVQVDGEKLTAKLRDIVRAEVEKDSNLLYRERSKSSILIGGAVDRWAFLGHFTNNR